MSNTIRINSTDAGEWNENLRRETIEIATRAFLRMASDGEPGENLVLAVGESATYFDNLCAGDAEITDEEIREGVLAELRRLAGLLGERASERGGE
jgi:hypothetical protein